MRARGFGGIFAGCATLLGGGDARADVPAHPSVAGAEVTTVEIGDARRALETVAWDDLAKTARAVGLYTLRFRVSGIEGVEVPVCAGRRRVQLDGVVVPTQDPAL